MLKVKFSRENKSVKIPTKREGDAGRDLYVDLEWLNREHGGEIVLEPLQTAIISTGLRSIIPESHYAQIQERGSTGIKAMKFGAGVLDASFRGIWNIILTNCSDKIIRIAEDNHCQNPSEIFYPANKGLAQFVFLEVPKVEIDEVSPEFILNSASERGEGKFGSSNK